MKRYMVIICIVAAVILLLSVFTVALNRAVVWEAKRSRIYGCEEAVSKNKKYDCILVLGAGVRPDGTPSNMLEDRLRGALSLYESGASEVILLSGDNSREHHGEVSVMEKYCIERGVPSEAIVRDEVGFSTSESIQNTLRLYGYDSVIVVTQRYHLYRAVYMARKMGMDADGFASDYRGYSLQWKYDLREYFARIKDFLKVNTASQK